MQSSRHLVVRRVDTGLHRGPAQGSSFYLGIRKRAASSCTAVPLGSAWPALPPRPSICRCLLAYCIAPHQPQPQPQLYHVIIR